MLNVLRKRSRRDEAVALNRAFALATEGRRAAIYERSTGLYAYWYLELRADEEILRAEHAGQTMACISIWTEGADRIERLVAGARETLRLYDMAAYLGNGHVVVVLTDTNRLSATVAIERIFALMHREVQTGVSHYPEDGLSFEELLEVAKKRAENLRAAA